MCNFILEIYNIFRDFFGNDKVDLQENDIIIWFPKLTVTNEHDKSIDITDLYVKVPIGTEGTINGGFSIIRSSYTLEQIYKGYCHSHVTSIYDKRYNLWRTPCLGTGPIRNTILSLNREYSEDMWKLFCVELDKYLRVESLSGVPYIKLETVTKYNTYKYTLEVASYIPEGYTNIDKFINYIISKKPFRFNYNNGIIGIAMSNTEFIVTLSNLFIEWYNNLEEPKWSVTDLYDCYIIVKGIIENNMISTLSPISEVSTSSIETDILTFKGEQIKLKIIHSTDKENYSIFLGPSVVSYILYRLVTIINHDNTTNIPRYYV